MDTGLLIAIVCAIQYPFLQYRALCLSHGPWKFFALLPLAFTSMATLYTANALFQDANLWLLVFIFAMPCIYVYLLFFVGAHAIAMRRARKAGT
jgi:hypothetical protein